jgi:NAD(P)-dependent dehydrogenase (short-subunit alcohol dehydrogenase family)
MQGNEVMTQENRKIALVTGANKGIGLEIVRQLAQRDVVVLLGARDAVKGEAAAAQLRADKLDVRLTHLDVTDRASISDAVARVENEFGRLDILVNNAGVGFEFGANLESPWRVSLDMLKATYETNVFGAFAVTQAFLPLIRRSPAGRIVNVSSTLGSLTNQSDPTSPFYQANTPAYSSSKSALNALTVSLAKELAETPIKVNAMCPGWVKTEMGGEQAPRTVEQGAREAVRLALAPDDAPTGTFTDDNGVIAW